MSTFPLGHFVYSFVILCACLPVGRVNCLWFYQKGTQRLSLRYTKGYITILPVFNTNCLLGKSFGRGTPNKESRQI